MKHWIIGIDEVGRGSLAGPVTIAVVALPRRLNSKLKAPAFARLRTGRQMSNVQRGRKRTIGLRDSKKLSPEQRETWFRWVKEKKIPYALASVSPKVIDKINITRAANLAATRAFRKLITNYRLPTSKTKVFLDGGLYINKSFLKTIPALRSGPRHNTGAHYVPTGHLPKGDKLQIQTIIKGDEKIPAISLASIIAKVTRDRRMVCLHKKYPRYNFHIHKGYGTRAHIAALVKYGPSVLHRLTFIRKFCNIRAQSKSQIHKS